MAAAVPISRTGLIALLYAVSGLTSLAYEVLWVRMLSLQFGVSVFAVVLTVAAFMGGLGAGSLFAARRLPRLSRPPLRLFALLEGGIALYALLLPSVLHITGNWLDGMAAQLGWLAWYGLLALLVLPLLLLPAFAMGAGFPLILAALGNQNQRLGWIYGINTLGAALGALLPLALLPLLGWSASVRLMALLGGLVAWAAWKLAARPVTEPAVTAPLAGAISPSPVRPAYRVLLPYAGIGAASLMLEVGWTRLFGMVMLRTEYVLAIILAGFLLGIGLGSLLAPRTPRQRWFLLLPVAACLFALLSLALLPTLSAWVERSEFSSLSAALLAQGGALLALTLPVTLALGAWLPLLNQRQPGAGMWLYGANSLGAALGAILAGTVLIPLAGSAGTVAIAAWLLLLFGLSWVESRAAWLTLPALAALAWPLHSFPPVAALLPKAQAGSQPLALYEDAVSISHVVAQRDGQRLLLTDLQRMDASTEPTAVQVQANQARLPLLLHPHPHSVLFLGLGTGISVSGSAPFPDLQRDAVELSQGAILAADRWFAPVNRGIMRQTRVSRDDARHFLSATSDHYDVIIGDVFHPDLVGLSSLLSVQQFQRARDRLNENGLFVQWLAVNQFDAESLRVVLRTFRRAFPDARLFLDGMHLALVGSRQSWGGAASVAQNWQRLSPAQRAAVGEEAATWLGRYWGSVPDSPGTVQDEWAPQLEFRLPRARYAGELDVSQMLKLLLRVRPSMAQAQDELGMAPAGQEAFERSYAASELMVRSWLAGLSGAPQQAERLMHLAYQANPGDYWVATALADNMLASVAQARQHGLTPPQALAQILKIAPRHVEAQRALWQWQRQTHDPAAAASRERLLELNPLEPPETATASPFNAHPTSTPP